MMAEYIIFNALVIAGPVLASFDQELRFVRRWKQALYAIAGPLAVFIMWDILIAGRHWSFNPNYTLSVRLIGLPVGEWIFFITVPFACIFVWEVINLYLPDQRVLRSERIYFIFIITGIIAVLMLAISSMEYAALVLVAITLCGVLDILSGIKLLRRRNTYVLMIAIITFTTIFNGYLTARPVILYNAAYLTGIHLGTIPLEDFGYGLALVMSCVILYETIKRRANG
ncbi:lycopene cyclase domain-containing protein [candidate division KSB1 bacterium]|nr:lycopene cyclase domain-containing protein [candidate division KSB1 bacterium]